MVPASQPRPTINIPAVVGVIVVILAVIIAWVVSGQMGNDRVAISPTSIASTTSVADETTVPTTAPPSTVPDPTTVPPTTAGSPATGIVSDQTSPVPLPSNVPNQGGQVTTTTAAGNQGATPGSTPGPVATVTTTTIAGSDGGSSGGAGDLGISGKPIQRPNCDGAFVTVVASAVGNDVSAESIKGLLDQYEGSNYLRTDQSCASFAQSQNGQAIYVVYLGPFAQPGDACNARSKGPSSAYVKRLTNDPNAGGASC